MKNKFQKKREETYNRLIETGVEVFCEKGYASTTLEDITSRAGYTKGAFYVHFKNKQAFFFQLMDHQGFFFEGDQNEEGRLVAGSDFKSTVDYWSKQVLNRFISSKWTLVFYDFYIQNRHDAKVQSFFQEYHQKWVEDISTIIDGLKMKGWVVKEQDSRKLAIRCYDIIAGAILHHHIDGEPVDLDDMTEAILDLLG
ncbi:TetR/AcrR family transcriptional regulator [Lentibacillus sediminis]|uniref:TetR/AcrR family transcriptional regulator n=1 Tax=Lentibacillus sediminis TaxID=1940529 RepID=UPI000C1C665C|nr:TetR/AcrR family transcriptional regulator [Lentibacillus sediminis]